MEDFPKDNHVANTASFWFLCPNGFSISFLAYVLFTKIINFPPYCLYNNGGMMEKSLFLQCQAVSQKLSQQFLPMWMLQQILADLKRQKQGHLCAARLKHHQRYSEFSVMDLFCGDEPNTAAEKCPTCEDHVSFSLEGLGKVGTETPDTMMQDIKVSPICSSDYPFNKVRRSLAIVGNDKHFYDHNSVSEEFFNKTKNSDENLWNEPHSSFSKSDLENDLDFYVASRSRLGGNFNAQNLIPEDVKDKSSLLSEESSSLAAEGKHRNAFASPRKQKKNAFASTRNKYSTKDEKCRSMPNSSKQMPSHYSNSTLQEELGAHNSWQFEERNPSVDKSSVAAPFCLDLEADFAVFGSKNKIVDPFSVFTTPELSNKVKASPSSGGFKKAAPLADSPPCSFTSEKFAFDCSTAFPNVGSWPTSPRLSPDFQTKGKKSEDKKENVRICSIFQKSYPKTTTQCLVEADSSDHVEEISSLLKKPDKQGNQVDKRKWY
ncbi:hypothetical protein HKD37_11G032245 [Glycine soja]